MRPDTDMGNVPQSLDLEQKVLACMLPSRAIPGLDDGTPAAAWASIHLSRADFYREAHQLIFVAILDTVREVGRVDMAVVQHFLKLRNELERAGSATYLSALADIAFETVVERSPVQVVRYGERLREVTRIRELQRFGAEIVSKVSDDPTDCDGLFSYAQTRMAEVLQAGRIGTGLQPIREIAPSVIDWIETERHKPRGVYGLRSGIGPLDHALQGFSNQRLVLVKGMTKHGKTAFCGQIVFQSLLDLDGTDAGPVMVFALEGSKEAFLRRFVAWASQVPANLLKPGGAEFTSHEQDRLIAAAEARLPTLPLHVTDAVPEITAIEREIRNAAMRGPVAGVLVDYAQLVTGAQGDNQERRLADVAERLQRLSNEIGTTILLPSQVTQQSDGRITEKGATALRDNCTLCLHVVRGEKKQDPHERLQSPLMNVLCEAARDDAPFGAIRCRFEGASYRIYAEEDRHDAPTG